MPGWPGRPAGTLQVIPGERCPIQAAPGCADEESMFVTFQGFLVLIVLGGAYFAPTVAAFGQRREDIGTIVLLNLLGGWTVIGWVAALALAMRSAPESPALRPPAHQAPPRSYPA